MEPLIAESAAFRAILDQARAIAASPHPVLLLGETGVGKERVARFIHDQGPRRERPFVAVNCAGIPEALLMSEMFGHVRGAFTSSDSDRLGHLRAATGGTLLLDEVGDLPTNSQATLLRALDGLEVYPLGSDRPYHIEARVIAATNSGVDSISCPKRFRHDLYRRLACHVLHIPSLRMRSEDIIPIAESILASMRKRGEAAGTFIGPEAEATLLAHTWPGNVRELRNTIVAAVYETGPLGLSNVAGVLARGSSEPIQSGQLRAETVVAVLKGALEREPKPMEVHLITTLRKEGKCSIRALSRAARIPRETVRRLIMPMVEVGLAFKGGAKRGGWVAPGGIR